jgi:hypothetical protein
MRGGVSATGTTLALTGDDGQTGSNNVRTNFVTGTVIGVGDRISSGWHHIFGGKRRRKSRKGRKGKKGRKGRKSRRTRRRR